MVALKEQDIASDILSKLDDIEKLVDELVNKSIEKLEREDE